MFMVKIMNEKDLIMDVIEKIRPFLISDGGNIEFKDYKDDIVYIKLTGACSNCSLIDLTLKDGIESAIKEMVPSVKEVRNVD